MQMPVIIRFFKTVVYGKEKIENIEFYTCCCLKSGALQLV